MARNLRRQQRDAAERTRRQTEATPIVYATLLQHGWLKRTLHISGDMNAVIQYDAQPAIWGRPVATVRLDGVEVASVNRAQYDPDEGVWASPALGEHHLSFVLPLDSGTVAVRVDAKVTSGDVVVKVASLLLTVGTVLIYAERNGRIWIKSPPDLPIAAAPSSPDNAALPLPAPPESEQDEQQSPSRSAWWKRWGH